MTMRDAKLGGPALCTTLSVQIWMDGDGWYVRIRCNNDVRYAKDGPHKDNRTAIRAAGELMKVIAGQ